MPNGIDLILADHQRINALFEQFDGTGDGALIGQVMDALTAHDDAEQSALYPLVGHVLGDPELIERSAVAHSAVKRQMDRIRHLEGQPLVDAFAVLRELVTAHVEDEEKNILPALQQAATPGQLDGLGARIEQTKQRVG
jgi:hemerythrin superfamily protein